MLGAIGKHDMKDIGGCWRGPIFFNLWGWQGVPKMTLRMVGVSSRSQMDVRGARKVSVSSS